MFYRSMYKFLTTHIYDFIADVGCWEAFLILEIRTV
jgi:hypothetical protein